MRILILGQGSIGQRHARILSTELGHEVEVVTRQETPGHRRHPTLEAAGDLERFDYFVVATATHLHHRDLLDLDGAVRGRPILVEKPLFFHETGFESARNRVYVGYNLRFHSALRKARELLAGKAVSAVNVQAGEYLPWWRPGTDYRNSYSARRSQGGGAASDLSHEIDYVQWLFGPLARLTSLAGRWSGLEIDSEDYVALLGVTERNVAVNLTLDYLSMLPVRSMLARARDFTLLLDLRQGRVTVADAGRRKEEWDFSNMERDHSYRQMHRAILERDGLDACTLKEGLGVMHTLEGIRRRNLLGVPAGEGGEGV